MSESNVCVPAPVELAVATADENVAAIVCDAASVVDGEAGHVQNHNAEVSAVLSPVVAVAAAVALVAEHVQIVPSGLDADQGDGDAVTTSYASEMWRKRFEDSTTEAEADAARETVRNSVLVWNRGLAPSGDSVVLEVRVPTGFAVAAKETPAGVLNVKQLFTNAKTPITPIFPGVVTVDAKEETALRGLAGPLPTGMRVSIAAVVQNVGGVRITHAAFFLGDNKNPDGFTYGFVALRNGVPDLHSATLVCGKESPTRQTDACTAAAAIPSSHFVGQFEDANAIAKTLAGWWVSTVNAYVDKASAASLPNEVSGNALLTTLTSRMDAHRLWGMRMCLCAKLHKSAVSRINDVAPEPSKRRKAAAKASAKVSAKSSAKPAQNLQTRESGGNAKGVISRKRMAGSSGRSNARANDEGNDDEEDESDGDVRLRLSASGGARKRMRAPDSDGDEDDDDDAIEQHPNADMHYGLTDIRQCGTVFMPAKTGEGPLYTREQIDDCLKDATQMFLYAACTGQKVSIVLGDSKKTTRVFDTFSRRA